jgi:dTDP-4-amino-4,6-dideoxygalactose transaminase
MTDLAERGVQCAIHYPVPIHRQVAYRDGNGPTPKLPVAETSAPKLLSLPLYPELKPIQINYVCDQIERWVERRTVKSRIGRPPSRVNTRPTRREATHG